MVCRHTEELRHRLLIHSIDIKPPECRQISGVVFHRGNGRHLDEVLDVATMERLPRPLIVIEDADHLPATTLAVLRFFDKWLSVGEYIVVEDGIVDDPLLTPPACAALRVVHVQRSSAFWKSAGPRTRWIRAFATISV